jgi:hypothetical protein
MALLIFLAFFVVQVLLRFCTDLLALDAFAKSFNPNPRCCDLHSSATYQLSLFRLT